MKSKKYFIYLIIPILLLIGVVVKISYSYFNNDGNLSSNTKYDVGIQCVELDLKEEYDGDNFKYFYPVKDENILDVIKPTKVEIKNNCQNDTNYTFVITSIKEKKNLGDYIKDDGMKILVLNNGNQIINKEYLNRISKINNGNKFDYLFNKYKNDNNYKNYDNFTYYELENGLIKGNSEVSYDIYLWIDYYEGDLTKSGLLDNTTKNKLFKYQFDIIINN